MSIAITIRNTSSIQKIGRTDYRGLYVQETDSNSLSYVICPYDPGPDVWGTLVVTGEELLILGHLTARMVACSYCYDACLCLWYAS